MNDSALTRILSADYGGEDDEDDEDDDEDGDAASVELERIQQEMLKLLGELNKSKKKQKKDLAKAKRAVHDAELKAAVKQQAEDLLRANMEERRRAEEERERELADLLEAERLARAKAEEKVTQALATRKAADAASQAAKVEMASAQRAVQEAERAMKEAETKAAQKQKEEQQLKDKLEQQLKDELQKEKDLAEALDAEKLARAKAEEKFKEALESRNQAGAATEKAMAEITALTADLRKEKEKEEQLERELEAEREKERQLETALAEEQRLHAEADQALAKSLGQFEAEAESHRKELEVLKKEATEAAKSRPAEGVPPRRPGEFRPGDVVDVDTEDGMEYGATVLGLSEGGDKAEMRVRFADGVIDDWPKADFRNVRSEEEARQAKLKDLEAKAAALEQKVAQKKAVAAAAKVLEEASSSSNDDSSSDEEDEKDVAVVTDFAGWLQHRPSQPPKKLATGKKADKEKDEYKRWVEVKVAEQSEPFMLIGADKAAEATRVSLPAASSKIFFSQSAAAGIELRTESGSYFIAPFAEQHTKLLDFSAFVEALLDGGLQPAGTGDNQTLPAGDLDPNFTYRHVNAQGKLLGAQLPLVMRDPTDSEAPNLKPDEGTGEGFAAHHIKLGARVRMITPAASRRCPAVKPGMRAAVIAGKPVAALPLEYFGLRVETLQNRGLAYSVTCLP